MADLSPLMRRVLVALVEREDGATAAELAGMLDLDGVWLNRHGRSSGPVAGGVRVGGPLRALYNRGLVTTRFGRDPDHRWYVTDAGREAVG